MNTDKRPTILCVEDSDVIQHVLKRNLADLDCMVDLADNGQQAVDLCAKKEYDLIFMDIGLPDMNGIEVTRRIKGLERSKSIRTPIIALTAHAGSDCDGRQACFDAGMEAVYIKPVHNEQLKTILKEFIGRE